MRSGAAIVALDTPYNREVCESAAIYTSSNPQEIADQIIRLIADNALREKLRCFARERAKKKYEWGQVCESYIEAIMRVTK
jgi:glycosyltransferase involved in cell wall biosynthesis